MGKRILVADDSRTIQQAFAMVMDGSGYTLSFAKSVDEALSVAKRDGRPDLVLSDAVLGTGSGYDLCAQLKADEALRDVPVYILASLQTPYDDARGRKVGADGHLAKPFESQALLDAVASALAMPVRRTSAPMPAQLADTDANTSRFSEEDVGDEDEDNYGEIVIERGPAPTATPAAPAWAGRPAARPSASRPIPSPTPSVPTVARSPMIPTPRPPTASAPVRTGLPPVLAPAASAPSQPRHTVMGFPTVRPTPAGRAPTGAPPIGAPISPTPSRPAPLSPPVAPMRPPILGVPAPTPAMARPAPPVPPHLAPPSSLPPRPAMPKIAPPPPEPAPPPPAPIPEPILQAPSTSRQQISPSVDEEIEPLAPIAAAVSSATEKIDAKIAALAARGPEFEAIAKLSREIIEQVVWEVVPELAEMIIRQEIDRLASAKK